MTPEANRSNTASVILWLLLGLSLIFIAQNRHSRADRFNYHSEIWSDKAGYHIYLAGFEYNWDGTELRSKRIVEKTGNGFSIDSLSGKFITKYTYGTALAISPFYIIGRFLESPTEEFPGFSITQNRMISLAAACWLWLGLFVLNLFLKHYAPRQVRIMTILALLFGTNLLYYGVQETGMSHVYSFTLFALYLYFLKKTQFLKNANWVELFLFGALAGWIVVLRQSNLLFLFVFLLLDINELSDLISRLKLIFKPNKLLPVLLGFCLLLAPQFVYWKYAHGQFLTYSYGNEGFYWTNPRLLKVWFSPYNGLFLYTPILLLLPISAVKLAKSRDFNGILTLLYFTGLSYLFSCWWEWNFGCAFGARSYVEYLSLFALPFVHFFKGLNLLSTTKKTVYMSMIILCCAYTFKMSFSVEGCFPGSKEWDWPAYFDELTKPIR